MSERLLGKVDGVIGVGVQKAASGDPLIVVTYDRNIKSASDHIPDEWEGVPVRKEESDAFRPI